MLLPVIASEARRRSAVAPFGGDCRGKASEGVYSVGKHSNNPDQQREAKYGCGGMSNRRELSGSGRQGKSHQANEETNESTLRAKAPASSLRFALRLRLLRAKMATAINSDHSRSLSLQHRQPPRYHNVAVEALMRAMARNWPNAGKRAQSTQSPGSSEVWIAASARASQRRRPLATHGRQSSRYLSSVWCISLTRTS